MAQTAQGQVQVGDDLRVNASGLLTTGYTASFGDQIPSSHGLEWGASGQLSGSYYDPNFLNFSITPYLNQSRANSGFQSLTNSSGVEADAKIFSGSRFPGYVSYRYSRDSTGTFGLVGTPDFTTVGNSQGFGIGWSALVPNLPTLSVSYSQGSGTGTVFGTNQLSNSLNRTISVRSTYRLTGWLLNAYYNRTSGDSSFPMFLSGQQTNNSMNFSGNDVGVNGSHTLPWSGSVSLSFDHSTYGTNSESTFDQSTGLSNYASNNETSVVTLHPTQKLTIYGDQAYTGNLNGYFYQSLINGGTGVPLQPVNTNASSSTLSSGANYNFSNNLFAQAQITYYNQTYFGQSLNGSYVSGTVGYGKRILDMFLLSATVIESSNQFANNSLGYILNLNYFRRYGLWETSGYFSYAQNVQTILVTYSTSYYNYNANVHRSLGRGVQWTGAFSGSHSGFTNQPGTADHSEGFSTSLGLRWLSLNANYAQSSGNSVLTSTGIQPIPPTPGLLPIGLIVYNGRSYGGGITVTPFSRLSVTGSYSRALSDTLSNSVYSNNRTDIYYAQFQYRLRQISILGGFTKFSQGISAAGTPPGNEYSYFIGVSRWIKFF